MKEIVERLQETRNIERAKEILESNGYKVTEKSKRLKESTGPAHYTHHKELWSEYDPQYVLSRLKSASDAESVLNGLVHERQIIYTWLRSIAETLGLDDWYEDPDRVLQAAIEDLQSCMNESAGYKVTNKLVKEARDGEFNPYKDEPRCQYCGSIMIGKKPSTKFCSEKCKNMYQREHTNAASPNKLVKEAYDENSSSDQALFDKISTYVADMLGLEELDSRKEQIFNDAILSLISIRGGSTSTPASKANSFESSFRTFEKVDWYGYAGASKLPDGSGPFISKGLDDTDILVTGNPGEPEPVGVDIYYGGDEGYYGNFSSSSKAKRIALEIYNLFQRGTSIDDIVAKYNLTSY